MTSGPPPDEQRVWPPFEEKSGWFGRIERSYPSRRWFMISRCVVRLFWAAVNASKANRQHRRFMLRSASLFRGPGRSVLSDGRVHVCVDSALPWYRVLVLEYNRTGGVTQTPREKLGVRGARHNPPNPRSFFCSQPSCDTVNKFVGETVLPNSFRAPTEPPWGHPRGVDQVKLRVLEASLI